ncbi:MAG: hypothetical protein RBG13Loki_4228 [Promethearchaeota archaeon CR_4]|nr:MAG: hypothetical protein RBG13Loki_4228 [Candidatus Lokiarchaeota archaeon CR_4]
MAECPPGKEKHHKIPKSLGGSDDPCNIKCVTPEEHDRIHREGKRSGRTTTGKEVRY